MRVGLQTWGSEGDVQPFTALAVGLTRAGHEVTLVVADNVGRDYSGLAREFGFSLRALPSPVSASPERVAEMWRQIIQVGNPIRQAELVMRYGFDPVMEAMFSAAKKLCASNDCVVGHFFVFPLRVAAEKARVPMATVNVVHNCLPSREIHPPGLPDLGRWSYPLGWRLVRSMINRIFLPRVNALRRREGLVPNSDVMTETWASERLNLLAVSPEICRAPRDWSENHKVCGFLNPPGLLSGEDLPDGLDEFLSHGAPPVYFTFGSMMLHDLEYIREAAGIWASAVKRLGCRAVFQLPWEDLGEIPVEGPVFKVRMSPYRRVFPRCSVVVHHGGAGTTQSSLLSGRPSVVVAHMADQFFWGSELERLRVAGKTQTRKGLSARRLASAIARVLAHPEMAERASEIGAAMGRENGVKAAVTFIEARLDASFGHSSSLLLPKPESDHTRA
jgi:UDP:flavonoid glycosyltransferase YjiC (YdhE family)